MNNAAKNSLRRLGWGLVFTIVDIRIMYVDVLPDFIGYMMIVSALHYLSSMHDVFKKAKYIAIVMIILSLPAIFINTNLSVMGFSSIPLKLHIFGQALFLLHILMAYWIFNGLAAIAKQERNIQLLDSTITRRNIYLVFNISQLIFYPFLLNVEDSWVMLFIVFAIISFIMELLFLRLPFRFSKAREKRSFV